MSLIPVLLTQADDTTVSLGAVPVAGVLCPAHVMVDATGAPLSASNPLRMAPAIATVDFIDRSGTVSVNNANLNTVVVDIPANGARKGGWIKAPSTNQGSLYMTLVRSDGTTFTSRMAAGDLFPMTVNPGYVIPHEIKVFGDTPSDKVEGVEFV